MNFDLFADIAPPEVAKFNQGVAFYMSPFYATQRTEQIGNDQKYCELRAAFDGEKWYGGFFIFVKQDEKLVIALELMCGEVKKFLHADTWDCRWDWPDHPISGMDINHVFSNAALAAYKIMSCYVGGRIFGDGHHYDLKEAVYHYFKKHIFM